jgi:adenosylcobinamide kinase/adenosylcobinamide-phosphate guanylyltransferase
MGEFYLVTGGVKSGKSLFAERLALSSDKKVIYLATATIGDKEMALRVERHKKRRPPQWETIEEPVAVPGVLTAQSDPGRLVLVDCLALYLSNLLLKEGLAANGKVFTFTPDKESYLTGCLEDLCTAISRSWADVIVVTNEVGWGLVPEYPLGRVYRDLLGVWNQRLAAMANRVYLVVCGLALEVKALSGCPATNRGFPAGN